MNDRAKPFLRWVGGKRRLAAKLLDFLPPRAGEHRYLEPFLGAGSLFFALAPYEAVLSDLNDDLIACYRFVRDVPNRVYGSLQRLVVARSEEQYYAIRATYNRSRPSAAQAARFIFLNHTCFNGVFRVSKAGAFNVPCGLKKSPNFPTKTALKEVSEALRTAKLVTGDYEAVLKCARKGDLIYLDPPYPPLNGTSNFTRYTRFRFGPQEQQRLAEVAMDLNRRGCLLMITNADTPQIRHLHRNLPYCFELQVTRFVTYKRVKHRVGELVITNYQPQGANAH